MRGSRFGAALRFQAALSSLRIPIPSNLARNMKGSARSLSGWRLWWPFALLCFVGGSRWVLSESLPGSVTTFASAALGCGSAAALYLLVRRPWNAMRPLGSQLGRSALGGALMISGPLLVLLRPGSVPAGGHTMALALTPVVIAVVESAAGHDSGTLAGRLWPGLAAIAGLLLLLAEPSLSNPAEDILLVLTPVVTGGGAVLFCSARESVWRTPAALLGACAALAVGAGANLATHSGGLYDMAGLAAGFDAAQALLSIIAISRLSATRWSAQFALVPLLVLLEGLALMPGSVPVRMTVGLVLLAIAGLALLIPPAEEAQIELARYDAEAAQVHPSRR